VQTTEAKQTALQAARNRGTKGRLSQLRPTKEVYPPRCNERTWEALANSGAFPLVTQQFRSGHQGERRHP